MSDTTEAVKLNRDELSDIIFALLIAEQDRPKCFQHQNHLALYNKLRDARARLELAAF